MSTEQQISADECVEIAERLLNLARSKYESDREGASLLAQIAAAYLHLYQAKRRGRIDV